jgi:hypothetical protein
MSSPSGFPNSNGLSAVSAQAADAAAALSSLKAPAQSAADTIDQAFGRAGASLAKSLTRAASDGKLSLQELAQAALGAVNVLAQSSGASGGGGGLGQILSQVLSAGFSGARADGGPVMAGGSYLVGERGPEVFRPSASGSIDQTSSSGGMTVNIAVAAAEGGLLRSEAQLAQALARAVALGSRKL